jgi:hypothetical protein
MTQDNAQARDPHFVPDVGTLDRWWESRRVEFEGDEALPDRSGTLGSAGDAPPFRAFAGSLEKDTLFAEARLPATHVEAWLATVVARAGKRLNVLPKNVIEMREALGLPPTLHDDDDAPPALFDDDLTAELEQGAPDEPAWARLEAVWNSTTGLGPDQTSEFSSSIKSKSIRLIFGRIDCSRRVLEAQSLRRNCRICAH